MNNRFTSLIKTLILTLGVIFTIQSSSFAQTCDNSNPYFTFNYSGPDTVFAGNLTCTGALSWPNSTPSVSCNLSMPDVCNVIKFDTIADLNIYDRDSLVPAGKLVSTYYVLEAEVVVGGSMISVKDTFCFDIRVIETEAPMFPMGAPVSIAVPCADDVPVPVTLTATDNCDDSFPKSISAVDTPPANLCTGGVITRVWTATDSSGQSTSVTQLITVNADASRPVIGTPPVSATVDCASADYPLWIATQRANVKGSVTDNCGVKDTLDNAPAAFPGHCGRVDVTFTVTDLCGNMTTAAVFYEITDTAFPTLTGITAANDTINLNCQDAIPPVPAVVAADNCAPNINANPTPVINSTKTSDGSCTDFSYEITRTWTVSDSCSNTTTSTQWVIVRDTTAPTFTVPRDTTINCEESTLAATTGIPTVVTDNCMGGLTIDSVDTVIDTFSACVTKRLIKRLWTVTDVCGNATSKEQIITVQDTTAPAFIAPRDTTIGCEFAGSLAATGQPTGMADNCDMTPELTSSDVQIAGSCSNQYQITRTWTLTDTCGNVFSRDQIITVIDTLAPVISSEAKDTTYVCDGTGAQVAFDAWIAANGRAIASDNCAGAIAWQAFDSGTSTNATLVAENCRMTPGVVRTQTVDFVVYDACGLTDTTTAQFTEVDNTAPVITICPTDMVLENTTGQCGATVNFLNPRFTDNCYDQTQTFTLSDTKSITSGGAFADPDVIVDAMNFSLPVSDPSISVVGASVTFKVTLTNVDGEVDSTEFFNVYAEDGTFLGETDTTDAQCGTGATDFVITNLNTIYAWMADGSIDFRLEPNIPSGPGRGGINHICNNASVTISAEFDANVTDDILFEYSVNGDTRQAVTPVGGFSRFMDVGVHGVKYYITDCAGNVDSCDFQVTVNDTEKPTMTCPAKITASTDAGVCTTDLTLELPTNAADNCGLPNSYFGTAPTDQNDRYLTFVADPNLNDYLAEDKMITFTGLTGNASGSSARLVVHFTADMDDTEGYFTVLGEDGTTIGTTREGQAHVVAGSCLAAGNATFSIPDATLNAWAADGSVTITLVSNTSIPVPPGGPGSGINPCNAAAVTGNGQQDGVSQVWLDLSFTQITPTYYADGVSPIMPTTYDVGHNATHTFDVGTTNVYYVIEDVNGNTDTCSYEIEVIDNERPVADCVPTIVRINPSGTVQGAISAMDIGSTSTDNCGIANMWTEPDMVDCSEIGNNVDVDLIVEDLQGNKDTCTTFVKIEGEEPLPSFSYTCGSDTLFLFANPPASSSMNTYTFRWYGPSGALISTEENPQITTQTLIEAGSYCVEIEGLTGCIATGCLSIPLDLRPPQPTVDGPSLICWDTDDITLTSTPPPGFTGTVTYNWYAGSFPGGTLLTNTSTPSHVITAPHVINPDEQQNRCYYLTITINGCESQPSNVLCLDVVRPPLAVVRDAAVTLCENEPLQLFSENLSPSLTFNWTGPVTNVDEADPLITNEADPDIHAGTFKLVVSLRGCPSEEATTIVNVLDVPDGQPSLAPLNQDVCLGNDFTLTTNLAGVTTYRWIPPIGSEIVTTVPTLTTAATMNHNGTWRVKGVVSYSSPNFDCETELSESVVVNVNAFTTDIFAIAQPDEICEGEDVHLQVSPVLTNATYEWRNPEDRLVGAAPEVDLFNLRKRDEGNYKVIVTNAAGCKKEAFVQILIAEGVEVVALSNNAPNCFSGPTTVNLSAIVSPADINNDYTYEWTDPCDRLVGQDSLQVLNVVNFDNCVFGNYQLQVTTSNGCKSNIGSTLIDGQAPIATPNITRNPIDIDHCVGDDLVLSATSYAGQTVTYTWYLPNSTTRQTINNPHLELNNLVTTDAGFYIVTVNVDGCESNFSGAVEVRVNAVPTAFPTADTPCEGGVLSLTGNYFPAGGTTSFEWETPTGGGFGSQNPTITNADPDSHNGTYIFTVTRDGCESAPGTVNVDITEAPFLPAPMAVDPICLGSGESLNLCVNPSSAEVGGTYIWTNSDGDTIGMTTSLCLEITDLSGFSEATPEAFFVSTLKNNCSAANPAPVIVNFSDLPTFSANAGTDFVLCDDDPLMLNAVVQGGERGVWTYLGGLSGINIADPTQSSTEVTGVPAGNSYQFSWSLSNGACENYSVDTVGVTIYAQETPYAGEDFVVCDTRTFQLDASPSLSGLGFWQQSAAQEALGVTIIDISDPKTSVTVPGPNPQYFFRWVIPDQVCSGSSDDVIVGVASPDAFAGNDFDACGLGDGVLLEANPTASGIGEWSSPDINVEFTDPMEPVTTVDNLSDGVNMFIWTTDNGLCGDGSRDTVIVNYAVSPIAVNDVVAVPYASIADFQPANNDPFADDFTITVERAPLFGVIENMNAGNLTYTAPLNFIGTDSLIYEICPDDVSCACTQATVYFEVGKDIESCTIPSIFTPNGDSKNEYFSIGCLADEGKFPLNELIIFNQWGDEVYRASPYKNDWFGTYESEDLPGGTYFYILDLGTSDEPMSGFLVIQR